MILGVSIVCSSSSMSLTISMLSVLLRSSKQLFFICPVASLMSHGLPLRRIPKTRQYERLGSE